MSRIFKGDSAFHLVRLLIIQVFRQFALFFDPFSLGRRVVGNGFMIVLLALLSEFRMSHEMFEIRFTARSLEFGALFQLVVDLLKGFTAVSLSGSLSLAINPVFEFLVP